MVFISSNRRASRLDAEFRRAASAGVETRASNGAIPKAEMLDFIMGNNDGRARLALNNLSYNIQTGNEEYYLSVGEMLRLSSSCLAIVHDLVIEEVDRMINCGRGRETIDVLRNLLLKDERAVKAAVVETCLRLDWEEMDLTDLDKIKNKLLSEHCPEYLKSPTFLNALIASIEDPDILVVLSNNNDSTVARSAKVKLINLGGTPLEIIQSFTEDPDPVIANLARTRISAGHQLLRINRSEGRNILAETSFGSKLVNLVIRAEEEEIALDALKRAIAEDKLRENDIREIARYCKHSAIHRQIILFDGTPAEVLKEYLNSDDLARLAFCKLSERKLLDSWTFQKMYRRHKDNKQWWNLFLEHPLCNFEQQNYILSKITKSKKRKRSIFSGILGAAGAFYITTLFSSADPVLAVASLTGMATGGFVGRKSVRRKGITAKSASRETPSERKRQELIVYNYLAKRNTEVLKRLYAEDENRFIWNLINISSNLAYSEDARVDALLILYNTGSWLGFLVFGRLLEDPIPSVRSMAAEIVLAYPDDPKWQFFTKSEREKAEEIFAAAA